MTYNVRFSGDRECMISEGYKWAVTTPRGDDVGGVVSRHRTYAAAERAAKGRDLAIIDLLDATSGAR